MAIACFAEEPATAPSPATQPLTVGPISYFEDRCARCHGSYGSGYLPGPDYWRLGGIFGLVFFVTFLVISVPWMLALR